MKAVSDTFRGNSRKNDKEKRQLPMYGGWRFLYASYRSYEPAAIVPVHKQMGAGWRPNFFWQVNPCRIMSKPSVLHGGSLLKPSLYSAQGRHPYEDIKNGGLDVTQNRRSALKIHYGRTKLPALQRFFSFPVWRGRIAWLIRFILAPVRLPLSAVKSFHR